MAATRTAALAARPQQPIIDIALFARPWDLVLLDQCFLGVRRFDQFQERLGISRKTLSKRLSSLVDDGVLSRELYQSRPERFEYLLTEKGRDLFPIVLAIKSWGERWGGDTDDHGWRVEHILCRHRCSARVICDNCTDQVHFRDVRISDDS